MSRQQLRVRWLIQPRYTICAGQSSAARSQSKLPFYPIGNEIFLDGDCCCTKVSLKDVVATHTITFDRDHTDKNDELFVHREWNARQQSLSEINTVNIDSCPRHPGPRDRHAAKANPSRDNVASQPCAVASLFSGCGILDHGLAQGFGEMMELRLAVECDPDAFQSLKANHNQSGACDLRCEDVNSVLKNLYTGIIPYRDYDCIIAGCPCFGFTIHNAHKHTVDSQKNCTLLAHTLSWVEIVLPSMVLIENVKGMDQSKPSALGQAVCHLVSIGYQAKSVKIKASDYGGATIRERLFIIATAPGIPLPEIADVTHGDSQNLWAKATAASVTTDLEALENDTALNPKHPDHVPGQRLAAVEHSIVQKIPRAIRGPCGRMCNASDVQALFSPAEQAWFGARTQQQRAKGSTTLRRIDPDQPYGTITTGMDAKDCWSPSTIHWIQDRTASFEEFRRWHGILGDFILIGERSSQLKQLGNSVPPTMSHLLGKALRESWSSYRDNHIRKVGPRMSIEEIHQLSDSDDEPRCATQTQATSKTVQKIPINVPSGVSSLPRKFRQSLSLELEEDEAQDRPGSMITPESDAACDVEPNDDLAELHTLLTPSNMRVRRDISKSKHLPITPSRSVRHEKQTRSRLSVRRRRSSSSPDESNDEDDASPCKRLRLTSETPTCTRRRDLRDRLEALRRSYSFTPESLSRPETPDPEGSSAQAAIVLDESD